jgi:hypothetical protein
MNFEVPKPVEASKQERELRKPLAHEKISGNNRIIGVSPEEELYLQHDLQRRAISEKEYENKEFTPEMREAITQVNGLLKRFLARFGLEKAVEITPEHIEYVDKWNKGNQRKISSDNTLGADGLYDDNPGKIYLFAHWEAGNYTRFIHTLVHEMIHMQSFQSQDAPWDQDGISQRRVGTRIALRADSPHKNSGKYNHVALDWLNEGITEELAMSFMKEHKGDIGILKGMKTPIILLEEAQKNYRKILNRNQGWDGNTYYKERKKLNVLVESIFQKGKGEYRYREDVLKLFTGAALNGRLLPVARAIEKAEGRGMFKELAKLTAKDL